MSNLKIAKKRIKDARIEYQLIKKTQQKSFILRLEQNLDSFTLKLCEPFERKAQDIRWKRQCPEEYRIHYLNVFAEDWINKIKKQLNAKKNLKSHQIEQFMSIRTQLEAVPILQDKIIYEKSIELLEELNNLMPADLSQGLDVLAKFEELISGFGKMI